jgi:beta-glucanase (GH16 family)
MLTIFTFTNKPRKIANMNLNKSRNRSVGLSSLLVLPLFFSCSTDTEQKIEQPDWQLSWSDEFNGKKGDLLDQTKWSFDLGRGQNGWGNQELQYYTDRPQNVSMDGEGNLVITAIKENYQGAQYTSARLKTKGAFDQQYGKFEARLKTPYGQGLWPAFWMLGSNIDQAGWPKCGEIDIMEVRGQEPTIAQCALHGPGYSGGNSIIGKNILTNSRYDNEFHTFGVVWDETKIDMYIDNYMYRRIAKTEVETKGEWVYDHPFFMILNVAVGGNFLGSPAVDTPFPQQMVIDYVKVYK